MRRRWRAARSVTWRAQAKTSCRSRRSRTRRSWCASCAFADGRAELTSLFGSCKSNCDRCWRRGASSPSTDSTRAHSTGCSARFNRGMVCCLLLFVGLSSTRWLFQLFESDCGAGRNGRRHCSAGRRRAVVRGCAAGLTTFDRSIDIDRCAQHSRSASRPRR